jgi:hypothetical protein
MGHWVVNDMLLGDFLAGMFPKLRSFSERSSGGITFKGVLNMIRTKTLFTGNIEEQLVGPGLRQLNMVTVIVPHRCSLDEMYALGVRPESSNCIQERLGGESISKARICLTGTTNLEHRGRFVVARDPIG